MKVIITGAAGFIGTNLVKKMMEHTIRPTCLIRPDSSKETLSALGVTDFCRSISELSQVDAVVHLAARVHQMKDTSKNPLDEFRSVNVEYVTQLAKESLERNIKCFVFISSVKVYGENPGRYNESIQPDPQDPYGISKYEAEQALIRLFENQTLAKLIILRLPMVYGPGNKGNILALLKAAKKRYPLPLGSAHNKRSFVYVENVVDAIRTVLEDKTLDRPAVSVFNIADAETVSSSELYNLISLEMNGYRLSWPLPRFFWTIAGHLKKSIRSVEKRLFDEYCMDNTAFCSAYGWQLPFTLKEGINKTVQWYLKC